MKKNRPAGGLISAAVIASLAGSLLFFGACSADTRPDVIPPPADPAPAAAGKENPPVPPIDGEEDEEEAEPQPAVTMPYYYDGAREGRYAAFAAAHPGTPMDDVYWMVDCDLDIPPYEETHELPDPDDILLLVNKHFYLPEGFAPTDLVEVGRTMMRKEAGAAMQEMIDAAAAEGLNLWSQSGYRSYGVQVSLYRDYSARDGEAAADTYSARPGYSEHQTGLTTDLNTITDAFGDTAEGQWVAANCWEYGYIVRYTKENTDVTLYKPEPWHMRYIGRAAAETMHEEGILSLEEYWVKYVLYHPPGVG
jgi:D-alanyl-D-alanine carboxypeptidase